jgi:hypothetical protein
MQRRDEIFRRLRQIRFEVGAADDALFGLQIDQD